MAAYERPSLLRAIRFLEENLIWGCLPVSFCGLAIRLTYYLYLCVLKDKFFWLFYSIISEKPVRVESLCLK